MLTQEVRVDEPTGRNLLDYLQKAGMSERGIDELHKLTISDLRREESDHTNDEWNDSCLVHAAGRLKWVGVLTSY